MKPETALEEGAGVKRVPDTPKIQPCTTGMSLSSFQLVSIEGAEIPTILRRLLAKR